MVGAVGPVLPRSPSLVAGASVGHDSAKAAEYAAAQAVLMASQAADIAQMARLMEQRIKSNLAPQTSQLLQMLTDTPAPSSGALNGSPQPQPLLPP